MRKGDKIALITPASPITEEKLKIAIENVEKLGCIPVFSQNVLLNKGYLAGDDKVRATEIHKYFEDKNIKAIWAIRGGYGCARLLPYLDFGFIAQFPKIFAGYSDLTVLLNSIERLCNFSTFHAPMAGGFINDYSFAQFKDVLKNNKRGIDFVQTTGYEDYIIGEGKSTGKLVGGNLTLIASLCGTRWEVKMKGAILFLEDVGESPYRIDRLLTQLLQNSELQKVRGIIIGCCKDCEKKVDDNQSLTLKEVLYDRLAELNIPIVYGFPFGHTENICTLPLGAKVVFHTNDKKIKIENYVFKK